MPNTNKYRRRQVYLGVFVLLLSVFSVAEGVYFRHQDQLQRNCIGRAFADLSDKLQTRGQLVDRETSNTNQIIERVFHATTHEEAMAAYRDYRDEERAIAAVRDRNPVPDYPQGKCDGSSS